MNDQPPGGESVFKKVKPTGTKRQAEYALSDEPPNVSPRVEPDEDVSTTHVVQTICRVVTKKGVFNVEVAIAEETKHNALQDPIIKEHLLNECPKQQLQEGMNT